MYSLINILTAVFLLIPLVSCCSNPEVNSKFFSTLDATIVTNTAYISEFSVKCGSAQIEAIYAELEGNVVPVSIIGPNKYQVSWTEENSSAKVGERMIRIFNEDGFTAYRKALRSGEDVSTVPALFNISVYHPGAFTGPWLKSEFIATILSLLAAYFAIVSRAQVLS